MNWKFLQENSNSILMEALNKLKSSELIQNISQVEPLPGNYLISHEGIFFYIGEGGILNNRIKQQFTEKTSTFYKTYLKRNYSVKIPILNFNLNVLNNNLGRKEVEEFGIVNFPTRLNKFELGKKFKLLWNKNYRSME